MRAAALLVTVATALAFAGAAACKGDRGASVVAVVPGAPAGDVTELTGDVHATRDGKARALAKGDVVSGDDVIATGADGRVTIVLRHNQVAWVLGPGVEKKVGDSAAWAAAKGASAEVATDDKSAAAGRHAERSAADTAASTSAAGGSSAPAGSGSAGGSDEAARQAIANAQDEADRQAAQEKLAALQKEKADVAERLDAAKAAAERAERKKGVHVSQECLDNPLAKGCGGDDGDVGGPGGPSGGGNVEGDIDRSAFVSAFQRHAAAFRACYEKTLKSHPDASGKLVTVVTIGGDGKVTGVQTSGDAALAPMYDCVKGVARSIRFPAPGSEIEVSYPMVFKPSP